MATEKGNKSVRGKWLNKWRYILHSKLEEWMSLWLRALTDWHTKGTNQWLKN